jgi:hypothetical protein
MSKGAKHLEYLLLEEKEETKRLLHQALVNRNRILHLESKLLSVDFSLRNWWMQKILKRKTTDILNYE